MPRTTPRFWRHFKQLRASFQRVAKQNLSKDKKGKNMSLLREIQDAAIDSKTDLASLLRQCKILAARLGSAEFGAWVDNELSGYKSVDDLPDYRIFQVSSEGVFRGLLESERMDIPSFSVPEEYREKLSHSYIMESVASIEVLVEKLDEGLPVEFWNPDFVAWIGKKIYRDMTCMKAWKVIPQTALIAILDEIRNRILNFVLQIEAENPAAGEAEINSKPVPSEKVTQIFNTHISGDAQNVSIGGDNVQQHATNTNADAELFTQLINALKSIEDSELRQTLTSSVEEMRSTQGTDSFKDCYQKFMSLLADHMQVLGPVVAPYLPALAKMVS